MEFKRLKILNSCFWVSYANQNKINILKKVIHQYESLELWNWWINPMLRSKSAELIRMIFKCVIFQWKHHVYMQHTYSTHSVLACICAYSLIYFSLDVLLFWNRTQYHETKAWFVVFVWRTLFDGHSAQLKSISSSIIFGCILFVIVHCTQYTTTKNKRHL